MVIIANALASKQVHQVLESTNQGLNLELFRDQESTSESTLATSFVSASNHQVNNQKMEEARAALYMPAMMTL